MHGSVMSIHDVGISAGLSIPKDVCDKIINGWLIIACTNKSCTDFIIIIAYDETCIILCVIIHFLNR